MADEATLIGVINDAVIGVFVNLADIMEDAAGHEEIAVQTLVMAGEPVEDLHHRQGMLQKAADINMMKPLGGGGALEETCDLLILKEGFQEGLQRRRLDGGDKGQQVGKHPVRVFLGHGKVFFRLDLVILSLAGAHNRQLDYIFVLHSPGLDIDKITLAKYLFHILGIVPHLSIQFSRFILETQVQVRGALLEKARFFSVTKKKSQIFSPDFMSLI